MQAHRRLPLNDVELNPEPPLPSKRRVPSFAAPPYPEYIAAIREGGVKIVETAGRSPEQAGAEGRRDQGDPQMHLRPALAES